MLNAYQRILRRYADFEGRTDRSTYWSYLLLLGFQFAALYVLGRLVILLIGWPPAAVGWLETVVLVTTIPFLLPTLAATVRRLQDTGRMPWWLALGVLGALPILGYIVSAVLLYFLTQAGTPSANAYGPPPAPVAHP